MRICFISAGAFAHIGIYLDYFRDAGHDVHFVALSPSPSRAVPTYNMGFGGPPAPGRGKWRYPIGMIRARRLVRRLRPDIVHAHYATSGGLAGLICDRHPTVVTAHGTDLTSGLKSRLWRVLLKAVFMRAACVNTVSADLTRMAVSLGVDRSRITELNPGIDTSIFHQDGRRRFRGGEPVRLICTRRLESVYDPFTIIEALAILRLRGVAFQMTFAGDGRLRGKLEELADRRRLGNRVKFLGTLAGGEIPAVLRAHDIYLSASRADGASLSLLEAMSAGLFPVVSRIRANEAWLEHEVGGLLHEVGNPAALADSVVDAIRAPELTKSAALLNRARVIESGDRSTNMKRLERIYEALVVRS